MRIVQRVCRCFFVFLPALPIHSAPGDELPVNSPFFKPYEGDFFIEIANSYQTQNSRLAIPAISSSREVALRESFTTLALLYGVTENFTIGFIGKYMWQRLERIEHKGLAFAGNPSSSSRDSGFYDPGFVLGVRFWGTRSEEWFVNMDFSFIPGLRDANNFKFTWPQNQYTARMAVGSNNPNWSYGLLLLTQFYDSSELDTDNQKNNQILGSGQLFFQFDVEDLFIRCAAGTIKFLDSHSNKNTIKRRFFPTASAELGILLSDAAALSAGITYVAGARGDLEIAIFTANMEATPIWQGTVAIAWRL